jgi:hypothetical protein
MAESERAAVLQQQKSTSSAQLYRQITSKQSFLIRQQFPRSKVRPVCRGVSVGSGSGQVHVQLRPALLLLPLQLPLQQLPQPLKERFLFQIDPKPIH